MKNSRIKVTPIRSNFDGVPKDQQVLLGVVITGGTKEDQAEIVSQGRLTGNPVTVSKGNVTVRRGGADVSNLGGFLFWLIARWGPFESTVKMVIVALAFALWRGWVS